MYNVVLHEDGNAWCALIGEDLQSGIAGYGDTPGDALRELAENFDKEQMECSL